LSAGAARSPVQRVRLGVIGVGDVAERDYLPEAHRIADVAEIVAVAGQSEERARRAAQAYGVPVWVTGFEALLEVDEVDAIVNLTPLPVHAEINAAALRAGKHVYSEKPLAETPAEARALRDAAAAAGLVLIAAPSVLLFPQVRRARAIVEDGELGPIHSASAFVSGGVPPWPGYASDPSPYFAAGWGPLLDTGVYPLHALTGLLGPVIRVVAASARTRDEFTVADGPAAGRRVPVESDDNWHLIVQFRGGALASIGANFSAAAGGRPECQLFGERATLGFSLLDVGAPVQRDAGGGWNDEMVIHDREGGPDHILGVRHLAECVLGRTRPVLTADHAVHVIDVLDAAQLSARDGCAVDVTSVF
jgi:predicted dehydrogenase